jgi:AcrR family transcriptional regulator
MSLSPAKSTDPRALRTRKLLQDALRGLIHERRFAEITVQDIAERSTVNRATFYAHFEDKHALLESILREDLSRKLRHHLPENATLSQESLLQVALAVFEFLADTRGQCPKAAQEFESVTLAALQGEIYRLIHGWVAAEPNVFPGHSRSAAATVVSWGIFGAAHRWSHGERKRPFEEVAREIVELLLPKPCVERWTQGT